MKQIFDVPELGEVVYEESFWTGRKKISVNGGVLEKVDKKTFMMPNGECLYVIGNSIKGVKIVYNEQPVATIKGATWYEIVLCVFGMVTLIMWGNSVSLCKLFPIVGGGFGGALAAVGNSLALYFMRKVTKPIYKILIWFAVFFVVLVTLHVYAVIILSIL